MKKQKKSSLICELPPSGFTVTPTEVFRWAGEVVRAVKQKLTGQQITAHLWAWRIYFSTNEKELNNGTGRGVY